MDDLSVFDSLLDCAFVVSADGRVLYCNDPAASLCQVSIRRVVGKAFVHDLLSVGETGVFPFSSGSLGFDRPTPYIETSFATIKGAREGTCQLAVRPLDEGRWIIFVRDVSLEAALHTKYRSELAQKEDYARNLEKLVEMRTGELSRLNQTLGAILDSLGQGFFTFDAAGSCGPVYTRACEVVLGQNPKNQTAAAMLGLKTPADQKQFRAWVETVFGEFLPFDDLRTLGPDRAHTGDDRSVSLEYYAIRRADQTISDVVVVATDKTAEVEAQRLLEVERQFAAMVVKYNKSKNQFERFLATVEPTLSDVIERAAGAMDPADVATAFRNLHTLEGEAGAFSLRELRLAARACQQVLEPWREGITPPGPGARAELTAQCRRTLADFKSFLAQNAEIIRAPAERGGRAIEVAIDAIKAMLAEVRRLPAGPEIADRYRDEFLRAPVARSLGYFDGLVQSVAERLGKRVEPLVIRGGETLIDPEAYEDLFANMVHLFRNAVDHGLETPLDREFANKSPAGRITIDVSESTSHLKFMVTDDGRGIDPAGIRAKLKERFPGEDHSAESDFEIIQAVCRPNFSSRDQVGEFSGRGVGLDALREEVLRRGGQLIINSKINEGTTVEISVPRAPGKTALMKGA